MYCQKCGRELPDDAVFCHFCGAQQIVIEERTSKPEETDESTELHEEKEEQEDCNEGEEDEKTSIPESEDIKREGTDTEAEKQKFSFKSDLAKNRKKYMAVLAAIAVGIIGLLFATKAICFHSWQPATCTQPITCEKCQRTKGNALGHKLGEATCTEPKTCTVCGATIGSPLGHDVKEWQTVKEATCTAAGEKKGTCDRCGNEVSDSIGALGHDWNAWETIKEPTYTEKGSKKRSCKRCGTEEPQEIPVLEPKETEEDTSYQDEGDTVFSPQDVSDKTIESIVTYGDYLTMCRKIIDDYFANYEKVIKGTVLYDAQSFQNMKDEMDKSYAEQEKQYGEMRHKKLVGKSALVDYLKSYRDGLADYVNSVKEGLDIAQ